MLVITSIKPQKFKADRFNIFLDGKIAFSLPAETLVKASLREGLSLTEDQVQELVKQGDFSLVFDKVLRFLSIRPRSEFEINEYMLRKGWGEKTRNIVLEKLKQLQLIDDEAFAKWWIEQRSDVRPEGRNLVKMELRRKGIDKEVVEDLLSSSRPTVADELLAEKIARKKLERISSLPFLEIKKKLYYALGSKGFSYEVIGRVIDKLLKKE